MKVSYNIHGGINTNNNNPHQVVLSECGCVEEGEGLIHIHNIVGGMYFVFILFETETAVMLPSQISVRKPSNQTFCTLMIKSV